MTATRPRPDDAGPELRWLDCPDPDCMRIAIYRGDKMECALEFSRFDPEAAFYLAHALGLTPAEYEAYLTDDED